MSSLRLVKPQRATLACFLCKDMAVAQMNLPLAGDTFQEFSETENSSETSSALLCPPPENLHLISQ